MSKVENDKAQYMENRDSSVFELLQHAARSSGRSVFQIQKEFKRLSRLPTKINMVEYVRNGMHHSDRFTSEERERFISNDLHWPITDTCCDETWRDIAEDKLVAAARLNDAGVAVPETLAVLDTSGKSYPGTPTVASEESLRALLKEHGDGPLFCKIVDGMVSFGAFRITESSETEVVCGDDGPMSHADFLNEFVGTNAYVVQKELSNHRDFAEYASALGTVRMVNLVRENDVYCPVALIKLPQGPNIADAFWRDGNLACEIDVDTGVVKTVTVRGVETEFLDDHPTVSGLMGRTMPYWKELREMNAKAAQAFAPIKYQSTDIAITDQGPVVVEINYGGSFDLPQYASGRGLLTDEVKAFFESCGVTTLAKPKARGWFRRSA